MPLRRQVERAQLTADISRRLQERRTIIDNLLHEPTMQLSTMQDIAGCQAVVPDPDAVRQVVDGCHDARLRKLEIVEESDELEVPRPSGYRAYHLIVRHGEQGQLVEVQLRSQLQHAWAVAVESVGRTRGQSLKTGQGTPELPLQFLIVFNHEQSVLHQDVAVLADAAAALRASDAAERHCAEQAHIEVVLVGSGSLDTVCRTHANHFDGTAALERLLSAG